MERYKLDGTDARGRRILTVELTMTDPQSCTGAVVLKRRWAEVPNGHLLPYECNEEMWLDRLEELAEKASTTVP